MKYAPLIMAFWLSIVLAIACVQAQSNQTESNETEPSSKGLQGFGQQSPYEFPNETGFEHPIGSKKITEGTAYIEVDKITEEGMSWLMETRASIEVKIKGEKYLIEVTKIEEEAMTVTMKGVFNEQTIPKGERKKYDVDADEEYDLIILYHKQFPPGGRFADMSLYLTNERIQTVVEDVIEIQEKKSVEEIEKEELDISSIVIMSSVLLLAMSVFFYIVLKD